MIAAPATGAVRVRIRGHVQGVWYRGWTVETARALGLRGWVRNRSDGSVEALFVGPAGARREMVDRCRAGPPAARVDRVDEEVGEDDGGDGFRQLPTT